MELNYTLIPGGFIIESDDGRIRIRQPFSLEGPGFRPMEPDEAEAAALALIAEIQASAAAAPDPEA
ncbi:hypothetical protein DZC30_02405 [Comamonas testosteroni]|uniref:Uncharacterized protein n=1 Tax=Comamonas testosteroni TaxID=285 RepID=A0A373FS00_COMTE|nr:hypothetical protein [Comamonas testosteroni]RGE46647.1 hypothetical protein DZC30_02405 [Comamonas testosteroni]